MIISLNMKCVQHQVAKILKFENLSLWQKLLYATLPVQFCDLVAPLVLKNKYEKANLSGYNNKTVKTFLFFFIILQSRGNDVKHLLLVYSQIKFRN